MNDAFLSQEIIHNCADMCSSCVMRTSEVDFGMVSMFSRTGAPQKGGPHRPENVGRQHDIFGPVGWGLFMPYCDI